MLQKKKEKTKQTKNGTDICWKQILNNQNCCKSLFFFPFPTQAPEHETTEGEGEGGLFFLFFFFFEIYEELAYNRKNLLCTHPTNKQTCHSQPGSLHQHPWGDCTSWGGGNRKLHMIRLFIFNFFFLYPFFLNNSQSPPPPNHLINHLLSFKNLFFGLQATMLNNSSIFKKKCIFSIASVLY